MKTLLTATFFATMAHSAFTNPAEQYAIDLTSDTAWTLSLDGAAPRPIKVPGGGWNSDQQSPPIQVMKDVKDFVIYERTITIPKLMPEQSVKLCFGAVTYGCEVFLDGKKVGEHHGPQVAFDLDLTRFARPGKAQSLKVKAFHRRHYLVLGRKNPKFGWLPKLTAEVAVGWDYPIGSDAPSRRESQSWCWWHGQSKVGYGIVRTLKLVILPGVHVEEVFVRPSVSRQLLSCEVWLHNETDQLRHLTLAATLRSWNNRAWRYPSIPSVSVSIPANSTTNLTLGPLPWILGPESYWWPNIPFREDYLAQLHFLDLNVSEGQKSWNTTSVRFGFVEHAEGPYYYTVNGVRFTGISDSTAEGQVSHYDAYSSAAFSPPTKPGTGVSESWRRYMRIGFNMNRLHCSPPTEAMMLAADEVGFMLIPEAPIWGNGLSIYSPKYTPQTYHDLGRTCRNHPCVARYSLSNEVKEPIGETWPWRAAIDHIRQVDDIHPLVFELSGGSQSGQIQALQSNAHAWMMQHYADINEKVGEGKGIHGMGEHFWCRSGGAEEVKSMGKFAVGTRILRLNDWCYMSGWSWINYWPNFLEGMNHDLHAWKHNNNSDRVNGVDGWGSPIVQFTQRSLHPYLVQDVGLLQENPGDPRLLPNGRIEWPYQFPVLLAGRTATRKIAMFNGGLRGNQLTLHWSAHWDDPHGPEAVTGGDIPCLIEPGFHAIQPLALIVPKITHGERTLCLVLESRLDNRTVFQSEETRLKVIARTVEPSAVFSGADQRTQGDWAGRFGTDGYELIGRDALLPGYAQFAWIEGKAAIRSKATADKRALAYEANPPTGKDRIVSARTGATVCFTIDVGAAPRRLSLYFLDDEKKNRKQSVEILDTLTGKLLNQQDIAEFADGRYLSWDIQGAVKVIVRTPGDNNAVVNGIFLDPATVATHTKTKE